MKSLLYSISGFLTVLGAINWGLVGLFGQRGDVVQVLLGTYPQAVKLAYIAIGVAGLLFAALQSKDMY